MLNNDDKIQLALLKMIQLKIKSIKDMLMFSNLKEMLLNIKIMLLIRNNVNLSFSVMIRFNFQALD
jgi:hypothetical protein